MSFDEQRFFCLNIVQITDFFFFSLCGHFLGWEWRPLRWTTVLVIAKCYFLLRDAEFTQSCDASYTY